MASKKTARSGEAARELTVTSRKSSAKKTPAKKHAAKKQAKKSARPRGHDLRRAYEHLHRVQVLHSMVAEETVPQMNTLSQLAQQALGAGQEKAAADLLRAAEHLGFGALSPREGEGAPAPALVEAAQGEYEHLVERAQQHWGEGEGGHPRGTGGLFKAMLAEARAAQRSGAFARALEFVRGAEALARVVLGPTALTRGQRPVRGHLAR